VLDPPQLAPHDPNLITYKQQPVIQMIRIRNIASIRIQIRIPFLS
jgi:hypothetical protein